MPFKIRDLMIDIATTADRGVAPFVHYTIYATYCRTGTMCPGVSYLNCPYASVTATEALLACGISGWPTGPGPVDLGSLKEKLRAQLAEIETQERAAEAAARPQTREQAAELEEKLQGALEEIQSLKRTLPSRD
jgi:hypothetical protein